MRVWRACPPSAHDPGPPTRFSRAAQFSQTESRTVAQINRTDSRGPLRTELARVLKTAISKGV